MAKRKVAQTEEQAIEVQEVKAPATSFLEQNQNILLYVAGAVVLLVAGWWLYKTLVIAPQQKEAVAAMWQAEAQFERDSFAQALDNPGGGADGFVAIVDKYGSTPAGNTARYYAGICYLQKGDFDSAIQYLEDFKPDGELLPIMKYGILGDCYSEKKEFDKGIDYYEKAADAGEHDLLTVYYLKKLGMLNEMQGNKAAAKEAYTRIKMDFPNQNSQDWRDIDKYIQRVSEGK